MGERFVILLGCGGRSACKINAKGWMTSMTHLNKVERLGDYDIGPTTEPEPHVGILDGESVGIPSHGSLFHASGHIAYDICGVLVLNVRISSPQVGKRAPSRMNRTRSSSRMSRVPRHETNQAFETDRFCVYRSKQLGRCRCRISRSPGHLGKRKSGSCSKVSSPDASHSSRCTQRHGRSSAETGCICCSPKDDRSL